MKTNLLRKIAISLTLLAALLLGSCAPNVEKPDGGADKKDPNAHVHTESEWIKDKAPTCKEDGSKHKVCTTCGEVIKTMTIAKTYTHTSVTDPRLAPTETENGYTEGSHCSVCGIVLKEPELIPMLCSVVLSSDSLSVEGRSISGTLSRGTESFDFASDISISTDAPWVVSTDEYGMDIVWGNTVTLSEGNNRFYIHLTLHDQSVRTYTVDILVED